MNNFDLVLIIVVPAFGLIIAMLYFLVNKDANASIAAYEKKTGKKISVKPLAMNKNLEQKLDIFEKILTKPLTVKQPKKKKKEILKTKNKKK